MSARDDTIKAVRIAQRDANVTEILTLLGHLYYSPSKFKADEVRGLVGRATQMIRDLHTDVRGWEAHEQEVEGR